MSLKADYLIVGGGTAGCVMASRLSENPSLKVVLVEAGRDYLPTPEDVSASYAGRALYNPDYFWPAMKVRRNADSAETGYEQARLLGGGSSINGQVALRGSPADYDAWERLGARGWSWNSVLPYFRKLEADRDFTDQFHGAEGPIAIGRVPAGEWDGFTNAVVASWEAAGHARRADMNGTFEDGFAPVPVSHDGKSRVSTAGGYLTPEVRSRKNLEILSETEVRRLLIDGRRVQGVEVLRDGEPARLIAENVILCAGALRSPWLMLKSGIGPAAHLKDRGASAFIDLPGVGQNLQDHPTVSIVAYTSAKSRRKVARHNFVNLVYSSGIEGAPAGDMVMSAICKTAWHALGDRLSALSTYVGKPFSLGDLRLSSNGAEDNPDITFNWLSDDRDMDRAVASFRLMADFLTGPQVKDAVLEVFATGFSPKVKKLGALATYNKLLTGFAGQVMDSSAFVRHQIIRNVASDGHTVDELLQREDLLRDYLRRTATGIWHPCGTCRMGAPDDPATVVDPDGRVVGMENLFVADASVMPEIPTTNLNIPTIMVAEHIAGRLKAA